MSIQPIIGIVYKFLIKRKVINMENLFNIDESLCVLDKSVIKDCSPHFKLVDEITEYNQLKVLKAYSDNNVSDVHFNGTTGYGYGDIGRESLDRVFSQIVGSEDALVRHNFTCGTHALTVALFGILRPNDIMVCVTGTPYDTIQGVIGITNKPEGTLKDFNINYQQIELLENSEPDFEKIKEASKIAKVIYIQRSRGYSLRNSLSIKTIKKIIETVKRVNENTICFVDNCYGEFVEKEEPTQVGADLIVGSLIKNVGGGLAKTGGYIAGNKDLVGLCSYRLNTPGTGKKIGCTLDNNLNMYMGIFSAPTVTGDAIKASIYTTRLYEQLGFNVLPKYSDIRSDIVSIVFLENKKRLISFCKGIQKGSPVDGFVSPEPSEMAGYDCEVIMAGGSFIQGASIEISADAPLREPFCVFVQGGLNFYSAKIAILLSAQNLLNDNLL